MPSLVVPVLAPPAELHDESLGAFEAEVTPHIGAQGPGLVMDLAAVTFISSSGLAFLVKVGMRLDQDDRRIALAAPSRRITKLLRVTGLGPLLPQYRTVDDAQAYVAGG